jgi:phospholipid/cholesterol/gamma-HCH transport system substrate-binding protein
MNQVVGAFIILASGILILSSFYLIKEKKLFEKMKNFYTYLNRGDGVSPSTKIYLKGIEIGYVTEVYMEDNGRIMVHFQIFPKFAGQLRGVSYLKVASGSFIGGKQLEIMPSSTGDIVADGSWIMSEDEEVIQKLQEKGQLKEKEGDMNKKIDGILNDVKEIVKNIKFTTTEMRSPESDIQRTLGNVRNITANIAQLTEALAKTTPEIKQIVVDSQSAISETNKLVKSTRKSRWIKMFTPADELPTMKEKMVQMDSRDFN